MDDTYSAPQHGRNRGTHVGRGIRRVYERRRVVRYIPNSDTDRKEMLSEIGVDSIEHLFSGIPERLRLRRLLNIPKALTEPELVEYFQQRASKNPVTAPPFIGAGIYRHYIPIVIDALISRSE